MLGSMTIADELIFGQKPPAGLRLSYEEFLETEFDHNHYEWVDGEVVEMNAIDDVQSRIQTWLLTLLSMYVEAKDLGEVFVDPFQMKTGPDLPGRQPDIQFIAKDRLHLIQRKCMRGPCDLAMEVVSYGSRKTDRVVKFGEYEQGGVREYWVVDPLRGAVEHFHLANGRFGPGEIDEEGRMLSHVLPGVWFMKDWFFDRPAKAEILKQWGIGA